ncbi:MAG TPA: hypothetical protein VHM88_07155, partial [Candidatus Acidoferrales bacterium]|nr:hypothetical protein [Candidatus Acidoferrales bacterium]
MGAALFVCGGIVHFVLWKGHFHWWGGAPPNPSFIDHPATILTVTLSGGAFLTFFLWALVREALQRESVRFLQFVLKGCLYGVISMGSALEAFYVSAAVVLTLRHHPGEMALSGVNGFIQSMIVLQTYGLVVIVYSIPVAAVSGGLAAAGILRARKHLPSWSWTADPARR